MSAVARYLDEPEQIKRRIADMLADVKSSLFTVEPKRLFPYFNPRRRECVYFWLMNFPVINDDWVFVGYTLSTRKNRCHVHRLVFARRNAVAYVVSKLKPRLVLAKGVEVLAQHA
jgi:hypothetical protein